MDGNPLSPRDSIYVAPLRIEKKRSNSNASRSSRKSRNRTSQQHARNQSLGGQSQSSQQVTPPLTPRSSQQSLQEQAQLDFHPFLRAFYPFQPGYSADSSTITLSLNAGDLILVHSVHTNGWADGTLLSSGARGWLPTNYCEAYETPHIRLLLKACLMLFDQYRIGSEEGGVTVDQHAVTALVAGVRHLLETTECLTREAQNVRSSDDIRKSRKILLAELSGLVKGAKKLSDKSLAAQFEEITDELMMKSFKVVLRGVRFLDIWYELYELTANLLDYNEDTYMEEALPRTPPCDSRSDASTSHRNPDSDANPEGYFGSRDAARETPQLATNESHPLPSTPYANTPQDEDDLHYNQQIEALRIKRPPTPVYALARLGATHDILLSYLGSYIGRIHLQARFTPQLQLTQQQSVEAARDLLEVVEAVYARDPRATALQVAKEAMYQRITSLVAAANDIYDNRIEDMDEEEDGIMIPDGGRSLVEAATGCVRGAGDCVARSKFVIERIGDFVLGEKPLEIGLGITADEAIPIPASPQSPIVAEHVTPMEICAEEPEAEMETPALEVPVEASNRVSMPPPPTPAKEPPPPPPKEPRHVPEPLTLDTGMGVETPMRSPALDKPLPSPIFSPRTITMRRGSEASVAASIQSPVPITPRVAEFKKDIDVRSPLRKIVRAESIGAESISAANSINSNSIRGSEFSLVSQTSTRATTPEPVSSTSTSTPILDIKMGSQVSLAASGTGSELITESHSEDLTFNKEGQITGGTLPALIERLTIADSTPDAVFVATFYLTFRLFSSPKQFAEALIDRFSAVGASPAAQPVRLRVYNVFKGWLESHWRKEVDQEALEAIIPFSKNALKEALPSAAMRLHDLAEKVSAADRPLVPRLVCGMTANSANFTVPETPILSPIISRSQMNTLKAALAPGGPTCSILDFDPTELARQFTLKESRMFCSIRPEELIAQEWTKKKGSIAINVLAMSSLSTDLAHLVAETILDVSDIKKRAVVIKHWIKIADRCLELNNYDSLMAIMCTLNASTIIRLKKTWEIVSPKTKAVLENLRSVIDVSKNHAVLRARLRSHVPPCLPFLGTYLTDLTFVDVGNPSKRPVSIEGSTKQLINFDKHVKTARIISELQRFQIPYRIAEVNEMQTWIDFQIARIHNSKAADVQHLYRRSLMLEPREQRPVVRTEVPTVVEEKQAAVGTPKTDGHTFRSERFNAWAHKFKTQTQSQTQAPAS
ncbi:ras guanine nucleotide exchange factor domain-containing protein [Pyronema domesticum]|uniref:Similar to Cell division control protein 25 acc. no. P04821 n=1 Tax=Pyronema omphalodes (strain CBS 100304) TaxID=1076935 RepID=U4KYV7_PYROM|nr:ras guanine nucleotide exchange factor domain-containing protein [Pyronema domesticum]CCX04819.1 Similar to Cell division control protein 25; acc. no. P04821 [Pyronema omphalodes CBS 100304]